MIEILKTSYKEEVCTNKIINAIKNNYKCVLIVDSDDLNLAIDLKKKHILMETFIDKDFLKRDSLINFFPNVYYSSEIRIHNICDFFISLIELDINNLDEFNRFILESHRSLYRDIHCINTNYFSIVLPKHTFKINRNSLSDLLIQDNTYNLMPPHTFENKTDYVMVASHGISFLSYTSKKEYYDLTKTFIDDTQNFFSSKGFDIDKRTYDLFINGKKFFGGAINKFTAKEYIKSLSSMTLVTDFNPEKDFFYNDMKYCGHNVYTGIIEETNISFNDILNFVVSDIIRLAK